LDIGDSSDSQYGGRSFTSGRRVTDNEAALSSRCATKRFNSAKTVPPAANSFRGIIYRMSQPRGNPNGRFGSTPRYSSSSNNAHQSSAMGSSTADSQSKHSAEQVGTSQSASTAREHGLSARWPVHILRWFEVEYFCADKHVIACLENIRDEIFR